MSFDQILIALAIGAAGIFAFHSRCREEEKLKYERLKPGRKTCLMEPLMLPAAMSANLITTLLLKNAGLLFLLEIKLCLVFLNISLYYVLLLAFLPILRKVISARACAALWLAPTLLYAFIWQAGVFIRPLFVFTLPRRLLFVLTLIWACGFIVVMLRQITSHVIFRKRLLQNAAEFENEEALNLWNRKLIHHGIKAKIPILVSDAVDTPLTIGCFEGSMRLVLPKHNYSDSELDIIFRHELRHIVRCDTRTKFFIGFCAAMCWYNPLAWTARRKVADDLELSCDEAVLEDADENTRKGYARLLLDSAGTGKGFTTCLSSSAETLRYRLRNVLSPGKRLSGDISVGIAILALFVTLGAAAPVDEPKDVRTAIFSAAPQELTIARVSVDNRAGEIYGYHQVYEYDAASLTEYISSLTVRQVYVGNYEERTERQLYVDYAEKVDGNIESLTRFELCGGLMFVNIPYDDFGTITYLLEEEIDWEYINSLLNFDARNPNPDPEPPASV